MCINHVEYYTVCGHEYVRGTWRGPDYCFNPLPIPTPAPTPALAVSPALLDYSIRYNLWGRPVRQSKGEINVTDRITKDPPREVAPPGYVPQAAEAFGGRNVSASQLPLRGSAALGYTLKRSPSQSARFPTYFGICNIVQGTWRNDILGRCQACEAEEQARWQARRDAQDRKRWRA
jgi:hypothetical protein